ncbi:sensor domain-containing diguanylate cyclase [Desulfosporosinus sp. BICA1-9]|uniref:sensor domain-containing diguanylate cyclase n=1 Tax=Desulfosporosinus sp. BICA1-9 TaxID=1531958 RepID=UPI00054C45FE|nr:sensor domain-containing diguanylate cyclase [Desulfosporosinus sp. BICA1-9]KJS50413.1 MAG: diguanylate cyclase [Peptococcaceae bacterium BRH_c23]KJS82245.1 MAG: diguanylate cyclase [Desulfosporosinus sp. BICA1-9]KJS88985.1 MAG: diguanylate cyclase [Desulfosporosinus sp. BICA1-9]HBW37977.1 GGDEF domain-containing protein [Desulfosporosinus sp.]
MSDPKNDSIDITELYQRINVLENQLEEIRLQTHVLLDIARALNASLDPKVIATNIISAIVSLISINQASVCLYNEKKQDFEVIGVFDSGTLSPQIPPQLDLSFLFKVLSDGVTYYRSPTGCQDWEWICCLPLQNAQHKIGTINIHSLRQTEITPEQMKFLETIAGQATSALENALLYAIVERESITDGLTGVYNHRYFQKRLREHISLCQRRKRSVTFGLLIIDVDNFKQFNDRYGHQFGDTVLQTIVRELQHNLREEDLIARYGGEEFVVLIPEATEKIVLLISEKIREVVEKTTVHYPKTSSEVSVTVSIGVTLWHPSDSPTSVIYRADHALHQAKTTGRNQSVFE